MSAESQVYSALLRSRAKYVESAKADVLAALGSFPDLAPGTEHFTFPDNVDRLAFRLKGTIPVLYKGSTYNIPVAIFLWDTHPYYAPICKVCPTETMMVRESKTVDRRGRVYLPYLTDWRFPGYDLSGLLQVMTVCFQEVCPVFSKPKQGMPAPPPPPPPAAQPSQPTPYTPYPLAEPAAMPSAMPSPYMPYPNAVPPPPPPPPVFSARPDSVSSMSSQQQPDYMKASILSAVEDKIKQRLREKLGTVHAELASIKQTRSELRGGEQQLKSMLEELDREQKKLEKILITYQDKRKELSSVLATLPSDSSVDIDAVIMASTPLHRQLVQCYVYDCTIDDAIYFLGQALKQGRITLPNYLKEVRQLSRRQFIYRATLQKCRQKAKLPV